MKRRGIIHHKDEDKEIEEKREKWEKKEIKMPQMVPFYFMNQLTYGLLFIVVLLTLLSTIFLPMILRLYVSRLFISKL